MDSFCLYGDQAWQRIAYDELLTVAKQTGMLYATPENSGCEGVYVEVARWNDRARQWQRFAFDKFFDGDVDGETAWQTCERVAAEINAASGCRHVTWVHALPNYESEVAA